VDFNHRRILTILMVTILLIPAGRAFCKDKQPQDKPTLHLAADEPNHQTLKADEVNRPQTDGLKIIIVTHGWIEREQWPKDLAFDIRDTVDSNEWVCGWFDWHNEARVINPRDAAQYARDTAGKMLAEQILKLSKNPRHVHLIGHSAGSWVISEAAKIIAKQTNASIHLTFLDAYVPLGWDANSLGDISAEPNTIYWADQYLTQDITLKVTDRMLAHAHNVDIGDITPGIKDHKFPFHWYPATVLGKYDPNDKYAGKKLYYKSGDIEYGFARSLEAGKENWEKSQTLPMGREAIKMEKPAK
jgi:pimeloyl-ACP methyl ester carboxylesterase